MNDKTRHVKKLIAAGDLPAVAIEISYEASQYALNTGRQPDIVHLPCNPTELKQTRGQTGNYVPICATNPRPQVAGLDVISNW